jgi:hypothetical protein
LGVGLVSREARLTAALERRSADRRCAAKFERGLPLRSLPLCDLCVEFPLRPLLSAF